MIVTKATKPIKKLLGTNGCVSKVFDLCDRAAALAEYKEVIVVTYWLEHCEFDCGNIYRLTSKPDKYAHGFSGFRELDEAIEYFLDYIS